MLRPSTTTGMLCVSTGAATRAANQDGAELPLSAPRSSALPAGAVAAIGAPAASVHGKADMANGAQLSRQRRQELLGREPLMNEIDGVADQEFRKPHRSRRLDAALRAHPPYGDAAGDECGDEIDQDEHQQKLGADRTPVPKRMHQRPPRRWRQ